jgi:hypothetical protein
MWLQIRDLLAAVALVSLPCCAATAQEHVTRAQWTSNPAVLVLSSGSNQAADNFHLEKVRQAVAFWNRELAAIGATFRLGPVSAIREPSSGGANVESQYRDGKIVVIFSGTGLRRGHSYRRPSGGAAIVHMHFEDAGWIAHELGHSIGLRHNPAGGSVMSQHSRMAIALAGAEKTQLAALYSRR